MPLTFLLLRLFVNGSIAGYLVFYTGTVAAEAADFRAAVNSR